MGEDRRNAARDYWRSHLERCEEEGIALSAYAKANGLPPWQFYRWRERLRQDDKPTAVSPAATEAGVSSRFAGIIKVTLPNGVKLEFEGMDKASLTALLKELLIL